MPSSHLVASTWTGANSRPAAAPGRDRAKTRSLLTAQLGLGTGVGFGTRSKVREIEPPSIGLPSTADPCRSMGATATPAHSAQYAFPWSPCRALLKSRPDRSLQ